MPLSRLAGVGNFCFNFLSSFSQLYASSLLRPNGSRSFFTLSSHDFLGPPFFLFPVISSFITSYIWELMSQWMTWPYHHRQLWIIISLIFATIPTLSWRTSVDIVSTSLTPDIILIIQCSMPRKLALSATLSFYVSQQCNRTGLTQPW